MRNVVGLCILAAGTWCGRAEAQRIHQQDFEDRVTHFKVLLAQANAESALVDHAIVRSNPHGGLQAERMVVRNSGGDTCLVGYEFPKSLVVDELNLSVWVNANRPGVALMARVVLPHDKDPETGKATVILLEGDVGTLAGRWKNLTLTRPLAALKRKQNLLQGRRGASVDLREAYCDMLLLNVHTGIGESAVLIDDLQVGPLVDVKGAAGEVAASEVPTNMKGDRVVRPTVRSAEDKRRVEIRDGVLYRGDRAFFVRGVRRSSAEGAGPPAPIVRLAEAQFNTVFAAAPIDQATADEAEKHGVAIVPQLGLIEGGTKPRPLNRIEDLDFRDRQRWIGWHLGSNLDAYSAGAVRETVRSLRARDPQSTRPTFGTALQGWRPLSAELDVLVVQRHPLMTSLGLEDYGRWLQQRRDYAEPRKVMLNTLQTHPPLDVAQLTFGHGPDEAYGSSIGPTPAQMRLLAYASLQAGYRGLVYSADWALSDPAQGRDRMLQAALLNLEMTMFEPFFAEGKAPEPCRCSNKDFAAVVFPHQRALLVMVYSIAPDSQYVVGQASARDVDVIVSGAPDGAQAHAVSLGGMEGVIPQSSLGGRRIRLRDVDTAAFVLVTTDTQLLVNFQDALPEKTRRATPLQQELAELTIGKTAEMVAKLQAAGRPNKELAAARTLLERAQSHFTRSRAASSEGNPGVAFRESGYALRIARQVQHALWKAAAAKLTTPVSDPYAVSFYTLAEHYRFQAEAQRMAFRDNALPAGDFERDGKLDDLGWAFVPFATNGLDLQADLVADRPKQGRRCLQLSATAPDPMKAPVVVEHTRSAMVTPAIPVEEGQTVRIRGFVRIPQAIKGSVDGAMIWDSLGGETLALRYVKACDWTEFTLLRPVRKTGPMRLHLVMTGMGVAHFDDIRVEIAGDSPAPLAGRPPEETRR